MWNFAICKNDEGFLDYGVRIFWICISDDFMWFVVCGIFVICKNEDFWLMYVIFCDL